MALEDYITIAPSVEARTDCEQFGSIAVLRKSGLLDTGDNCGGHLNAPCLDPVDIRIEIQPIEEKDISDHDGHRSEGMYRFWFNPSDPVNIAASAALGNIGAPMFLTLADSSFKIGSFDASLSRGRSDRIEWLGQSLILCTLELWDRSLCAQTGADTLRLQTGTLGLYQAAEGHREATIETDVFATEGALL